MTQHLDTKDPQHYVSNQDIEGTYGNDYLKWKGWGQDSGFGKITKSESAYFSAEIKRTNKNFPEHCKVLEIGFGSGTFLKFARTNHWDACGVEINEELVKDAQAAGYAATHSDNLSGFADDTFDLVGDFDVLEHIPQDVIPNVIHEIKRVLKKDGVFIARFPNGDSPFGLVNQNGDITHITTIGSGKIHYFAARSNMEVYFVGGAAQPLFGAGIFHFAHRLITLPI